LVELLVVISIIATLAGVGVPVIMTKIKDGARAEAIGNIKQVGLAMFSFDQDYASYPSADTVTQVTTNTGTDLTIAGPTKSNDYFRQLIAAGYIDSERSFYAKGTYTLKPDNVMKTTSCLAKGECGFAYIMDTGDKPLSSAGNSGRPLLATSVFKAASDGTFDPDVYAKKAVLFRIDNSAVAESIRPSDMKVLIGAKTLLDSGDGTVWYDSATSSVTPTIVPPLSK